MAPGDRSTRPGRPRDGGLDERILSAAAALLDDLGYEATTIAAVAARAGVARATIYRRWPSKDDVVSAVLRRRVADAPADAPQDAAGALVGLVEAVLRENLAISGIIPELLDRASADAVTRERLRRDVLEPVRRTVAGLLERLDRAGRLRSGLEVDLAVDVLLGTAVHRARHLRLGTATVDVPREARAIAAVALTPD